MVQCSWGLLTQRLKWKKQFDQVNDWSAWLAKGEDVDQLSVVRRNIDKGLLCGSERFIKKLEKLAGMVLQYRPQGRPRKVDADE